VADALVGHHCLNESLWREVPVRANVMSDQVGGSEHYGVPAANPDFGVAQSSLAGTIRHSDRVFPGAERTMLPPSGWIHWVFDGQMNEALRELGLRLARGKRVVAIEPADVESTRLGGWPKGIRT
jgi:hypothetical protein